MSAAKAVAGGNVFLKLLTLALSVFIGFLTIGMQLPVLPLYLHETLGMSTLVVGLVIGAQFVVALLSRAWAGNFADSRGARRAVVAGLLIVASSGLAYLASLPFVTTPAISVWILLTGRIVLAIGESLVVTGSLGWGIGLVGPQNAGKVMAWVGIAMYAAFALGAPAGIVVNGNFGFAGIAVATILIPFVALAMVALVPAVAPLASKRIPFYKVFALVLIPGMGLALASIGFGMITGFIALLFAAKNWGNSSLAFTAFGLAFIAARLLFGHLPDKLGGAKVAMVSVAIEAAGLLLIWSADTSTIAYTGVALGGFGYSLAFPGFGVEAARRAPPQSRSVAMGAYVAFLDISLGIASPLAGVIAGQWGVHTVFLAAGVAVGLSLLVAVRLLGKPSAGEKIS
ncbi:arabinose transporter [Undibacterium sp. CY18W]|uniref:Arabinose transporter n=1 Tax=Undibacterium hunanense TaxID=2762292 RepID=A0ABR6ZKT5_9BURK|nr:arabinose transporter [Undibacterium hunanense]MBC3916497.1 arabinose transporter [Undibacterium hunanense]